MAELTKEYFDQQLDKIDKKLAKFATKQDLEEKVKNLVTKEEAKKFATKDDLKDLATKDDVLDLAKASETKAIRVDILGIKDELKEIKRDRDAYAKDIVRHDRQISMLTNNVKRLKAVVGIK